MRKDLESRSVADLRNQYSQVERALACDSGLVGAVYAIAYNLPNFTGHINLMLLESVGLGIVGGVAGCMIFYRSSQLSEIVGEIKGLERSSQRTISLNKP